MLEFFCTEQLPLQQSFLLHTTSVKGAKMTPSTIAQTAVGFFLRSGGCFLAFAVFTLYGTFGIAVSSSSSPSSSSRVKPCHRAPSPVPSLHDQIGRERLFVDLILRHCTLSQPPRTAAMIAGSAVSRFARTCAGDWESVPNLTELCQTDSIGQSLEGSYMSIQ